MFVAILSELKFKFILNVDISGYQNRSINVPNKGGICLLLT
jgi:hypothetical protein